MENNYKKIITDKEIVANFYKKHAAHVTHVAVAHSTFHPCNATPVQIDAMLYQFAKQLWHFTNCFGQALYGAKAMRKSDLYLPLYLITMEGAHASALPKDTIHAHFALGNLPSELSVAELKQTFSDCWLRKANIANDDIWFEPVSALGPQGWLDYITKEIKRSNMATQNLALCRIPKLALAVA